jgi:hypothetical protein
LIFVIFMSASCPWSTHRSDTAIMSSAECSCTLNYPVVHDGSTENPEEGFSRWRSALVRVGDVSYR